MQSETPEEVAGRVVTAFEEETWPDWREGQADKLRYYVAEAIRGPKLLNIERHLGLDARVEIIYVVDGYEATLEAITEAQIATGGGESIAAALRRLDDELIGR